MIVETRLLENDEYPAFLAWAIENCPKSFNAPIWRNRLGDTLSWDRKFLVNYKIGPIELVARDDAEAIMLRMMWG